MADLDLEEDWGTAEQTHKQTPTTPWEKGRGGGKKKVLDGGRKATVTVTRREMTNLIAHLQFCCQNQSISCLN